MPSDYISIGEANIEKYGTHVDQYGPTLLANLYSDRTHFVYELLQNAEDAEATRVEFTLLEDRLEVRHNGRPFNTDDVRAICGLVEGTKTGDLTKIGTFGIGFKSVYAYTQSPEVHSGDEHFVIRNYVRPSEVEARELEVDETLFVLSLDHQEVPAEQAFAAIGHRLEELGPQTLLFLRSIQTVEWNVPSEEESGTYLCEIDAGPDSHRAVTVLWGDDEAGDGYSDEEWLVFEREVESSDDGTLQVEVAFQVRQTDEARHIVRTRECPLSVFFPTEKETYLGFLANGPYRTTPARDNVDARDKWNLRLVAETGDLAVAALRCLRGMDLLDASALNALPIDTEHFQAGSMFMPIYEKIRNAIEAEALLPAHGGHHVAARGALLARGQGLRELLSEAQLAQVFGGGDELAWLSEEITAESQSTRDLYRYLNEDLGVHEITPRRLLRAIDRDFLMDQTDEWIVEFYSFLLGLPGLWDGELKRVPFVRTEDGGHIRAFTRNGKPNVYLPSDTKTTLPVVRRCVAEDSRARRFLSKVGLKTPDLKAEVIAHILPQYDRHSVSSSCTDVRRDLEKVLKLLSTMGAGERSDFLKQDLADAAIVPCTSATEDEVALRSIDECYRGKPELECYFEGNPDAWFVDENLGLSEDELALLDIAASPRVQVRDADGDGIVAIVHDHANHIRGLDGFDPDCEVDGLEYALNSPTEERSRLIWNRIALPNRRHICGTVERATRQTYENAKRSEEYSPMGQLLTGAEWLPARSGGYHAPSDLSLDDLPDGFTRSEPLAEKLGMRSSPKREMAQELGVPIETLENFAKLRRTAPEKFDELSDAIAELLSAQMSRSSDATSAMHYRSEVEEALNRPGAERAEDIPEPGPMPDPDGRRQRTADDIERDRDTEPSPDQRQTWVTKRHWEPKDEDVRTFLQQQYNGRCQICGYTFAKRNGDPYFEGVYLVRQTEARWVDRPGNVLCLCANCSAQWAHGRLEAPDWYAEIAKSQPGGEGGTEQLAVPVRLCGEDVEVTFTERHILELQELLNSGGD
jgi:hypothetical protein